MELFGRSMDRGAAGGDVPARLAPSGACYGSDVLADSLRALQIDHLALHPSPGTAALQDSLVNLLGNTQPRMATCPDSAQAVLMAAGFGRATGRLMAVACTDLAEAGPALGQVSRSGDPLLILHRGGTSDPSCKAALACDSAAQIPATLARAAWIALSGAPGPVAVALAPGLLEARLDQPLPRRAFELPLPQDHSGIDAERLAELRAILLEARAPVILAGRLGAERGAWCALQGLAEALGAPVITRAGDPAIFDPRHPLHAGSIGGHDPAPAQAALEQADVILALNWRSWSDLPDIALGRRRGILIDISGGDAAHPVLPEILLKAAPMALLRPLLRDLGTTVSRHAALPLGPVGPDGAAQGDTTGLTGRAMLDRLRQSLGADRAALLHLPVDWPGPDWLADRPRAALGTLAGGGLSAAIGAALGMMGQGRRPVAIVEAADFITAAPQLWTATHLSVPLLMVVVGRGRLPGAEHRQIEMARQRGRETANAAIGTRLDAPQVALDSLAAAFGVRCSPPLETIPALEAALRPAVQHLDDGRVSVLQVRLAGEEEAGNSREGDAT